MIKRITFIRVALSFLIVCLLVVPLNVDAASQNYQQIGVFGLQVSDISDYISFTVSNSYITTGYVEAGTYQTYKTGSEHYGVYHIKYYFPSVLTFQNEYKGYDAFVFQSGTYTHNMGVTIDSTVGDFIANHGQIKNVSKYYEFDVGGTTYKTPLSNLDVFIPYQRMGTVRIYPVIEFDIIVNLSHYQNDTADTTTGFTLCLRSVVESPGLIYLYGGNYISTGEHAILSKLDNLIIAITSKFDSLSTFLSGKFSELFKILEDDQEELINGFQGSGTDQASTNFDTSAGELHAAESQLTQVTNTSVNTYTDFAFDTTVLTTLGASLVYVVTWFTNFWDIGGLFTALLNIGLALFVAFFILRLRGSK